LIAAPNQNNRIEEQQEVTNISIHGQSYVYLLKNCKAAPDQNIIILEQHKNVSMKIYQT
jgi:hypothetical protein